MNLNKDHERFAMLQRLAYITGLYWRIGWALLVLFGMVGNCAGKRTESVLVFVIAAIVWTCLRILAEGIESWFSLQYLRKLEAAMKEHQKKEKDPPAKNGPTDPPGAQA